MRGAKRPNTHGTAKFELQAKLDAAKSCVDVYLSRRRETGVLSRFLHKHICRIGTFCLQAIDSDPSKLCKFPSK